MAQYSIWMVLAPSLDLSECLSVPRLYLEKHFTAPSRGVSQDSNNLCKLPVGTAVMIQILLLPMLTGLHSTQMIADLTPVGYL